MSSSAPERTAIAVSNLHVGFARGAVLTGLKWEVPRGAFVAMFGSTGSGKSTLLSILAGAMRPNEGTVRVAGGDPTVQDTRRRLAFMPQGGGLYLDLSVEDNLRIFAEARGLRAGDSVERALELVELRKRRNDAVRSLPVGQVQRVSLAAALAGDAEVLLLDEPAAYADPAYASRLWAHLGELADAGRTVVMATSHPHVAAQARNVAVLRAGRIAREFGTASLAQPGRATVRLKYREKAGVRTHEVACDDYRADLVKLVEGRHLDKKVPWATAERPFEVEVCQEPVEVRLARLLMEE